MAGDTNKTTLSVMLIVPDAVAALGWYTTALGAAELWNLGGVAGLFAPGALNQAGRLSQNVPAPVASGARHGVGAA